MFAMLLGCCSGNSFTLPNGRFHWPSEQKKWIQTDTFDAEDKEGLSSSCLHGFWWFLLVCCRTFTFYITLIRILSRSILVGPPLTSGSIPSLWFSKPVDQMGRMQDKVMGFLVFRFRERSLHVLQVAVAKDARGRGAGRAMLRWAAQQAKLPTSCDWQSHVC